MSVSPEELRRTLVERTRLTRAAAERRRVDAVRGVRELCAERARAGELTDAWLIGSAAWGGFGERSDVDVVVRGFDPAGVVAFADRLAEAAGVAIDLLRWEELSEAFRARVARSGERLA